MSISYHRLWTLAVAIFAINVVCTVMTVLRPILLNNVKPKFPSLATSMPEPIGDGVFENIQVDHATVRKTKRAEAESHGPDDIKILMHNPDVCKDLPDLRWIIYVHSAPNNGVRRAIIRRTWGNTHLFKQQVTRIVFVIGMFDSAPLQEAIEKEFRTYGDLVQGDFRDNYRNLTLKAILGLKWVSTHCNNARFVLKADDDAFIDVIWLYDIMRSYDSKTKVSACITYSTMPIMRIGDKTNCQKWCVDRSVFPGRQYYPVYCSGLAFVLSIDLIPKLYSAAMRTPTFWIDDVFVTGVLLAQIQGVHRVSLNPFFSWRYSIVMQEYLGRRTTVAHRIVHVPSITHIERMWNCLLRQKLGHQALLSLADGVVKNTPPCV